MAMQNPAKEGSINDIMEGGCKHEVFLGWLDKVADFINSLETPYGVKVPVIFRPWQENGENHFGGMTQFAQKNNILLFGK